MYDPNNLDSNNTNFGSNSENNNAGSFERNADSYSPLQPATHEKPIIPTQGETIYSSASAVTDGQQPPYGSNPLQAGPIFKPSTNHVQPMPSSPYSYTWSTNQQNQQPPVPAYVRPQTGLPKMKKERKGRHPLIKITAMILGCLIISLSTVSVYTMLLQNGTIQVNEGSSKNNAAFTINKILKNASEETTAVAGPGVKELTQQEVAAKLIPSVVCIQAYQSGGNGYFGAFDPSTGGITGEQDSQTEDQSVVVPSSQGSGIVLSKDGYIVTNAHVIAGAQNLKVVTSDGLTYEAKVIGEDSMTDLAVLKVDTDKELVPAEFGSSKDLTVADPVMAIGNPGGIDLNSSVTMGYVSALDREVTPSEDAMGYSLSCIQTDAAINPGNSGGALANMYGQVIGINSSKIVATGYEGLGFAIPSDSAQPIISDLMEHGYVKDRAMLGVQAQFVDTMTARFYGLTPGMMVSALTSEEAKKSGLKENDIITAIDGNPITSGSTIKAYLATKKPGDKINLTISRSGETTGTQIELVLSENTGE